MSSSLRCEINIIEAKNIQLKSHGTFFVRYYLSAANNKRIQINTKEISSKSILYWNESTSMECLGSEDNINSLKEESIVFELRWRSNTIRRSSKLVGSGEIPWRRVLESPKMEMEKWVTLTMVSNKKINRTSVFDEAIKPPSVQICMRVRMGADFETSKRSEAEEHECGCCSRYCKCQDYEILAMVGAFEAAL